LAGEAAHLTGFRTSRCQESAEPPRLVVDREEGADVRVNVYVDAFNLYYRSLKGTPYRWLDVRALCERLLPDDEVHQIRYFTARVKSRPDNPKAPVRQNAYLRALATTPRLTIHEGQFLTKPVRLPLAHPATRGAKTVEVLRTEEKGSDVNLATHLLLDGFLADYEAAVVISNDSDLKEPIRVVRERLAKPVGVIIPDSKTRRSVLPADFYRQILRHHLKACQFPDQLKDSIGTVTKPEGW
jgi:hypothetical protein